MTNAELVATLQRAMRQSIHTWEDWYRYVDQQTKFAVTTGIPPAMHAAMFLMYSLLQAMREMPDEGDIAVLVDRTVHILVMDLDKYLDMSDSSAPASPGEDALRALDALEEAAPDEHVSSLVAALIRKAKG